MTLSLALAFLAACGACLLLALALALGIVAIRAHNRMVANHGGRSNA